MRENYHFIGIGGIGMGALALLLLEKGHCVSGSDLRENDLIHQLKEKGARVFLGHDASYVKDADFIIFSSAVKESNPEIQEALRRNIPIIRRAELLADLMRGHQEITVAGAHGKTTTTSMIAHLLHYARFDPTVAVGGMINQTKKNAFLGQGQYFVAEVDESDGSFLNFSPDYSIITNIDYEHPDYYESWHAILNTYEEFVSRTKLHGLLIGCAEDPNVLKLLLKNKRKFMTYGFSKEYDVSATSVQLDHFSSRFICCHQGQPLGEIILSVPGEHNVLNSLACICLGLQLKIDFKIIQEGLHQFKGVQRRLELIGEAKGVRIMDDYAHHPTEILATLRAMSHFGQKRLIVVFQPHRYTRVEKFFKEFSECFDLCDHLVVTDIYAASESPIEGVSSQRLVQEIQQKTKKQVFYLLKDDILKHLLEQACPGDCVLTLGAGDITQISKQFFSILNKESLNG